MKKRYNNSSQFYADYYQGSEALLVEAIREYAQKNKAHHKDEYYLTDLLK